MSNATIKDYIRNYHRKTKSVDRTQLKKEENQVLQLNPPQKLSQLQIKNQLMELNLANNKFSNQNSKHNDNIIVNKVTIPHKKSTVSQNINDLVYETDQPIKKELHIKNLSIQKDTKSNKNTNENMVIDKIDMDKNQLPVNGTNKFFENSATNLSIKSNILSNKPNMQSNKGSSSNVYNSTNPTSHYNGSGISNTYRKLVVNRLDVFNNNKNSHSNTNINNTKLKSNKNLPRKSPVPLPREYHSKNIIQNKKINPNQNVNSSSSNTNLNINSNRTYSNFNLNSNSSNNPITIVSSKKSKSNLQIISKSYRSNDVNSCHPIEKSERAHSPFFFKVSKGPRLSPKYSRTKYVSKSPNITKSGFIKKIKCENGTFTNNNAHFNNLNNNLNGHNNYYNIKAITTASTHRSKCNKSPSFNKSIHKKIDKNFVNKTVNSAYMNIKQNHQAKKVYNPESIFNDYHSNNLEEEREKEKEKNEISKNGFSENEGLNEDKVNKENKEKNENKENKENKVKLGSNDKKNNIKMKILNSSNITNNSNNAAGATGNVNNNLLNNAASNATNIANGNNRFFNSDNKKNNCNSVNNIFGTNLEKDKCINTPDFELRKKILKSKSKVKAKAKSKERLNTPNYQLSFQKMKYPQPIPGLFKSKENSLRARKQNSINKTHIICSHPNIKSTGEEISKSNTRKDFNNTGTNTSNTNNANVNNKVERDLFKEIKIPKPKEQKDFKNAKDEKESQNRKKQNVINTGINANHINSTANPIINGGIVSKDQPLNQENKNNDMKDQKAEVPQSNIAQTQQQLNNADMLLSLQKQCKLVQENILKEREELPSPINSSHPINHKKNFSHDQSNFQNKISPILIADSPMEKPEPLPERIKAIHEFTHVGFDGEADKENNQDVSFVLKNFTGNKDYIYMSVCDGHGIEGHKVSGYIKRILPYFLSENLKNIDIINNTDTTHKIINGTFIFVNDKLVDNDDINSAFSGSTCVSLIYTPDKLICPNIGDSRAVIGRCVTIDGKDEWVSHDLSRDHKPTEKDEAKRIIENGGRIQPYIDEGEFIGPDRVWIMEEDLPGLAMTRSFGDRVAATVGVTSVPEIKEYKLQKEDKFIILASDGVWEFIESLECVNIIKDFYIKNDIQGCCKCLYEKSKERWLKEEEVIDDITIILVFLE